MTTADAVNTLTLFLVLVGIVGMVLLGMAMLPKKKNLLLSLAAAIFWLAIGFWWVIDQPFANMGMTGTGTYIQILDYVPFLFFVVILAEYMTRANQVEVTRSMGGKSWSEFGPPPSAGQTNYMKYRDQLQKSVRRGVRK